MSQDNEPKMSCTLAAFVVGSHLTPIPTASIAAIMSPLALKRPIGGFETLGYIFLDLTKCLAYTLTAFALLETDKGINPWIPAAIALTTGLVGLGLQTAKAFEEVSTN